MSITDTPQDNVFRFPETAGATPYQRTYTDVDDCMNNLGSIISQMRWRLKAEGTFNCRWLAMELEVNIAAVQHLYRAALAALKRDHPHDSQIENRLNSMIATAPMLDSMCEDDDDPTCDRTGLVARLSEDFHRLDALLGERSLH